MDNRLHDLCANGFVRLVHICWLLVMMDDGRHSGQDDKESRVVNAGSLPGLRRALCRDLYCVRIRRGEQELTHLLRPLPPQFFFFFWGYGPCGVYPRSLIRLVPSGLL